VILEAADSIGGRVATDEVDGFLLDRGFQVLLTEYAEAQDALDYDALELRTFSPGALVRLSGRFRRVSDPVRDVAGLPNTILSPIGTVHDKFRILQLRTSLGRSSEASILDRPETTTQQALESRGFSPMVIERFFRPFLGGIMLDRSLRGSSRMFEFVFRMFSKGAAAVPADGMRRIPAQLAGNLPVGSIRLESRVSEVRRGEVVTDDGDRFQASAVVVAVDGPAANKLLGTDDSPDYVHVYNLYFAAAKPPLNDPLLILNGDGIGPVNNAVILTNVAPSYSKSGACLISVTVLSDWRGDEDLESAVRGQLLEWFGERTGTLDHIRTYSISDALPDQRPPFLSPPRKDPRVEPGIFRAGDYLDTASINGALAAGRRAAEAVVKDLGIA
ncbi:MAG: FAD-dependent oxidoreductase, partial [Rhodothermales bacterium]|nr:FAD-dependent oxidoreductase [Rhodothermales bacterium]